MKCPHCGEDAFNPSAKDGDTVPCVHCGGLFLYQSPYAPPKAVPTIARSTSKKVPPVKLAMLVATGGWVIAIVSGVVVGFIVGRPAVRSLGNGTYVDPYTSITYDSADLLTIQLGAAFSLGVVCPTVFYAIVMTILTVIWFATKR